jgi:SHS2 domain-containing protein
MGGHQNGGFEEIEHTADKALHIHGRNLEQLLVSAAKGMNNLMITDVSKPSTRIKKSVAVEALDAESLLVEWLSELAYLAETEMLVFNKFELHTVAATHVRATVWGGPVQKLEKHIKAVTYHNLEIVKTDTGLEATVVFDV